jgi:competence protein ComEA
MLDETGTVMENDSTGMVYVFITGCVVHPGVYEIPENTRLYELVDEAGGFTEDADTQFLNLAQTVEDGAKITVYSVEETALTDSAVQEMTQEQQGDSRININTADRNELMTLPGIGESKADAIIRYREENGKFSAIEEIMNISGIKEGAFGKIKDLITV